MSFKSTSSQSPPSASVSNAGAVHLPPPNPAPVKKTSRDEGNFRSHYYGKVGFKGVDDRKTIEVLLNEDPINVFKCADFAVKCSVPTERRLMLWKSILRELLIFVFVPLELSF